MICIQAAPDPRGPFAGLISVLAHTPKAIAIVLCGGRSPGVEQAVSELSSAGEIAWVGGRESGEPDECVVAALVAASPADVVLLRGDCHVPQGWLERLRVAACADTGTATASALTTAMLGADASAGDEFAAQASAVVAASLRLYPRARAATGPCLYIRRTAVELAGPFDSGFSERCLQAGLAHVLADDLLVASPAGSRTGRSSGPPRSDAARTLNHTPVEGSFHTSARSRALGAARRALHGVSVTIDARVLQGEITGTHVSVIEMIGGLAESGEAAITVLLPADPAPHALAALSHLANVTMVRGGTESASGAERLPPADIVHRPYQMSTPADLMVLSKLSDRLVVTNHDLISYHNPSYFRTVEAWLGYRQLSQAALAIADHVVFVSAHAREEALAEDLVESGRSSVVHNGVDHRLLATPPGRVPRGLPEDVRRQQLVLCLGTDFRHKNRVFALKLVAELHDRHGWAGKLVFAGSAVAMGSSRPEEHGFLRERPHIADAVIELGPVSEAEKAWLLERVALVIYPSVEEGFGLVPFEAAARGTPCLWAAGSSLSELLPASAAGIVPWDAETSAGRALELLRDEPAREANVEAVCGAAARLRWQDSVSRLLEVYRRTCNGPPSPAGVRERASGLMSVGLSEDAARLVGPAGVLPADVERPLLALATHRRVAAPVFSALKAGYAISRRARRPTR